MADVIMHHGNASMLISAHPLMEMYARVDDSVVERFSVPKGESNIVSREVFNELERIVEVDRTSPAGSSCNTALAYAYLGGIVTLFGIVGDDKAGRIYREEISSQGVQLKTTVRKGHPTSKLYTLITPDHERTMYLSMGAPHTLTVNDIKPSIMDKHDYYAVNGFLFANPDQVIFTNMMVGESLSRGKGIITLIANPFCVRVNGHFLKPIIDRSEYVSGNIEEYSNLYNMHDKSELRKYLASRTAGETPINKAIILTMGREGAIIFHHGEEFSVPAAECNVVDTTGAGDFFAGSVLYGMLNGYTLQKSGEFARVIVGDLISHIGCTLSPEVRAKVDAIKMEA
uniref:Adenosine kinase n=1 Tax=Babesia bovis TaxID=5865 RepID=S6CAJ7_BABBO|nr:adenosine kinase [Babesia bovis]